MASSQTTHSLPPNGPGRVFEGAELGGEVSFYAPAPSSDRPDSAHKAQRRSERAQRKADRAALRARKAKRRARREQVALDNGSTDDVNCPEVIIKTENSSAEGDISEKTKKRAGLSAIEQEQVCSAISSVFAGTGINDKERNAIIQANPQTNKHPMHHELWNAVERACPTKKRRALQSWARGQFHNFLPIGQWTKEQESELLTMVQQHGTKWSIISASLNRHSNDARDRYRVLTYRGNGTARLNWWSVEEEEFFFNAIEGIVDRIRNDPATQSCDAQQIVGSINWSNISAEMGFTRTKDQCIKKWNQLRASEKLPERIMSKLFPDC